MGDWCNGEHTGLIIPARTGCSQMNCKRGFDSLIPYLTVKEDVLC